MNPTLNSPKYADPKSLAFQMYKIQQERKNRKKFVPQLEQRYFRRNEGTTDYATIPEVTLAGDFVIEVDYTSTYTDMQSVLGGSADDNANYLAFFGGNRLELSMSGERSRTATIPNLTDGALRKIVCSRVGSIVTIAVDGINYLTETNTGTGNFAYLYANNFPSNNFKGILANLKIYDAGTLVRNYPINDGRSILANAATARGSELDGLTYALTTAIGGVASVVLSSLSVIGKTYLVEVSYSGVVGDASVRIGGFSGPSFTGTGTIEFVATATTTVNDILGALTGVTSGSVTVSIKESEGYGAIVNGNADDWGLFDKQANGDWLGQELVGSVWNLGAGWSFVGNRFTNTSVFSNATQDNTVVPSQTYRISAELFGSYLHVVVGFTSNSESAEIFNTAGKHVADLTPVNFNRLTFIGSSGQPTDATVSLKEVLKVA